MSIPEIPYADLPPDSQKRLERRARNTWVAVVVGMLGLQVVGGITTVVLAVGDPTAAIIPNYHNKAVNWDTTRRARQLTESLGYSVSVTATLSPVDPSQRDLLIEVFNKQNQHVENLNLHARVYHHAQGKLVHSLQLREVQPGVYAAPTQLLKAGMWQLELQIEGEHGVAAISREIYVE